MGPICLFSLAAAGVAFACGPSALRAELAHNADAGKPMLVRAVMEAAASNTAAPAMRTSRTARSTGKTKTKKNGANERRREKGRATEKGRKEKKHSVGGKRATTSASSGNSEQIPVPRARPRAQNADAKPAVPRAEPAGATVTWGTEELLAARARCVELLAPISADVIAGPPIRAGACGTPAPVVVESVGTNVRVAMRPPVTLNCGMVAALHAWLEQNVQPAARDLLGEESRNRADIGRTSEHGFANAIDILGFVTRSGRRVSVLDARGPTASDLAGKNDAAADAATIGDDSHSSVDNGEARQRNMRPPSAGGADPAERGKGKRSRSFSPASPLPEKRFLKRIHREACSPFTTVLGPDANEDHRNHFHFDLAKRRHNNSYCR